MKKIFICTVLLTSWLATATDLLTDHLIADDDFNTFGFAINHIGDDMIFELSESEINARPIYEEVITFEEYDSNYFSHIIADEKNCKYNCENRGKAAGSGTTLHPHHGDGVFLSRSATQAIFLANKRCFDFRANNMNIYGDFDILAPYFHTDTSFSSLTSVNYYADELPVLKDSHSDPDYKVQFTLKFKCAFKL